MSATSSIHGGRVRWICSGSMLSLRLLASLFRPRIAQCHGAIKYRRRGAMVDPISDKVTQSLELETLLRRHGSGGRLQPRLHHALGLWVDVLEPALAVLLAVRCGHAEQAVVDAHLGGHGVLRADPVDGALYLAVGAGHAMAGFRIERAVQFSRVAVGVLDHLFALDDADAAQ